jgi:NAD(P)-dependent dehydrogenase (short-subunit alcohol dehydrogenase family)
MSPDVSESTHAASPSPERRTALVTGAAVGLGRAIALALARDGFELAIADRDVRGLDEVSREINGFDGRALTVALDLTSEESIRKGFQIAADEFGRIDLLVNNAGVTVHKPAVELTWSDWDLVIDVNLKGSFFMSQMFGRHLMAAGSPGSIVNVGSTHGLVGFADRSVYGISKAGVIHMTKMLAVEWAGKGIRVNAIAPGTVLTPSRAQLLDDPEARQRMLDRIPLGRFPTAEEIAAAVVYLSSSAAASITGHTLVLDGGTTIC